MRSLNPGQPMFIPQCGERVTSRGTNRAVAQPGTIAEQKRHKMTHHGNRMANGNAWFCTVLAAAFGAAPVVAWHWPAWIFMWVMALALYGGFKCITLCEVLAHGLAVPKTTRLIYLLCWPGMSLREFIKAPPRIEGRNLVPCWLAPGTKMVIGVGLVWLLVPEIPAEAGLLRGWVGMVGIMMMLHFGLFHLLALALQAAGFNARPNMQAPLLARSLAEFWGKRWNTAFNVLADRYGFKPLTRHIGPHAALVVVFLASGLLHEAVITLPARGGYGLPTAYFALQGAGLLVERLPLIRRRTWLKRLLTWVVVVTPLGCLFPPVFVHKVVLPMLHAIGATGVTP